MAIYDVFFSILAHSVMADGYLLTMFLQFVLGVCDFADSRVEGHVDVVVLGPHVVSATLQRGLDAENQNV